jgi:hypothetical protein
MPSPGLHHTLARAVLLGFLAGAVSTLVFHQLAIGALHAAGAVANPPYAFRPVGPLRVPAVLNLAFWGGLWGIAWALIAERLRLRWPAWVAGLVFGAVAPTLVGWFVIAPMRGQPLAQGWNLSQMWIGPVVNGAWGLGTALIYDLLRCRL